MSLCYDSSVNKKIVLPVLLIVVIAIGGVAVYKRSGSNGDKIKESFTTIGSCSCPPNEVDKPEIINIRNDMEYQKIKAKDAYEKQHCAPNAGCSIGHTITYRSIE